MIYGTVLINKNLYFRDKSDIFAKEKTSKLTLMVQIGSFIHLAPRVGLEPTTLRLTAACSTD